jgi:chorismate mutase/prephenate dehydratase
MKNQSEITRIRNEIDLVDDTINKLLAQRAQLTHQMRAAKGASVSTYQPAREQEIIERVTANNTSDLPNEEIVKIFSQIILSCRLLQESI